MGKPLSEDLRSSLVVAVAGGLSRRGAALRRLRATAVRWAAAWAATGATRAKPQGGDTRSRRVEAYAAAILGAVEAEKDITLTELSELLERDHGACFARSTVWRFPDRPGLTFKKNRARRRAWFDAQPDLDPERLVFIDETGASTKMARLCGRAPRGERCRAAVPHGHRTTTTFVGALRLRGMTAPMVLERRRDPSARRSSPQRKTQFRTNAGEFSLRRFSFLTASPTAGPRADPSRQYVFMELRKLLL